MVLTSCRKRLTLTVFILRQPNMGYFQLCNVSMSYFILVTRLNGKLFVVQFILTRYFAMTILRYRTNFSSTLGLRQSTLVMCGCLSVATSTNCVDILRLTYNWELQFLLPTLLAYMLPLPRLNVRLRLILSFSLVVRRVNLKIGSTRNRNVSFCSELRLILTTQ
jgi:hypothetical protein